MDDLQIRLEKLSPEKRALVIKQLQRKKLAASASMPKISQREDTKTHPLSYAQQRMWFLNQWEPENPFYNITAAVRISGLLDPTVFSRSINEIIRRHEVLRARFVIGEDGYPIQEIADQVEVLISELDLTSFVGKKQDQELQRLMVEEAKKPFDLTVGPLIRINLIRLNANEYVVLLTIHHIVADGWSVDIFIREVATLYEAYSQGKRSPFAELSIQYADFAEWQRDWLQEDALEHQLDFWKQVYQSIPDPLELPLDRPRPVVQTFNGAVETLYMGRDIVDAIKELGQNRNTSIFMTLLAAFYVLLYRYSGQDDICIGSPVSNRNRTEIEGLIGLFVNTLALRADLSGGLTFLELLDQVRDITLGAYDYQDLPFEILFDALDIERDLSRTPLFQVMFALQEAPLENLRLPTIELNQVDVDTGTSKFDLTLFLEENSRGLKAMMEYNTDLFDAETISRMLNHFRMILRGIVQNPQRQLSLLPILTDEEFSLIINTWNDTATDYPRDKNIGQLFEIQVSKTPENIAITFGDEQLTYHELNQRANQLARYLQFLGVGPEILVGIYMERSIEMVVATLGIVKAGGAYMPLDTEYPTERLAFMLSDGHVSVVISDTDNLSNLADTIEHVINIGTDWKYISNHKSDNLPLTTCADNLLYVMYTSGSTGTPKGVSVTHRGVGRLVKEVSFARISQDDVFLQLAPISFDAATLEIWGPLLNGGRLVVAPPHKLTMDEIAKLLAKHQITTLWLTSSLFHIMVENHLEEIGQLDQLLAGGDVLSVSHVVNVIQAYPKIKMTNGYGPTENTTFSTTYQILDLDKISNTVPIGKPISNSKAYILDKDLQPVPIGVIGELFVGGDGLARNYINRPGLTAARFLPNPYSGIPGDRFYRTGDLSRLRSDGTIEFLGRIDFQIKIRGFRVELGEIETQIGQYTPIKNNVVLLIEDEPGSKMLVAYLVPKPDQKINTSDLRKYLINKLPDYMVPARFIVLEELPITPNGKVDRHALPAPDRNRPNLEKAFIPPRMPVEVYIAAKWQEVLGIDSIGIYDNFFELGGDSLKAAVLINRLQDDFGEQMHVKALFLAPTIAELTIYISEHYPQAVAKLLQTDSTIEPTLEESNGAISEKGLAFKEELTSDKQRYITVEKINTIRQIIRPIDRRFQHVEDDKTKNPTAVVILSPPRSGSTLFRTMLAGCPQLFAPPELDLLSFNTLAERREAFHGENSFWLEGVIRAIMEIKGISADQAKLMMKDYEEDGMTSKGFYFLLQTWIKDKVLVDKTPVYALDLEILKRAEDYFDNPLYIHLTRHPYASIYSFVEAKLDQVFFRYENPFSQRELAELVWIISHQNIQHFLNDIPYHRQMRISFEDLVATPENVMRETSKFLGIQYCPDMLSPYDGERMTSSVTPNGQMVGDYKFYLRKKIDNRAADRWKKFHAEDFLSNISIEIAEQLGYKIEEKKAEIEDHTLEEIKVIPRDSELPLSYAQQRLWFLYQWEPSSPFYNIPSAVRFRGPLNIDALQYSICKVIERHEILRTTFLSENGKPKLKIESIVDESIPITDLSELSGDEREAVAFRIAEKEAKKPFNLSIAPLLRAHLVQLGSEEFILLLTMHHIAADGWSINVLIQDIAAYYQAYSSGTQSPIKDLPIQYVDYAAWQRKWLEGSILATQLAYWKDKLIDSPPILELPLDKPRPPVQTLSGKQIYFKLPNVLSTEIRNLSNQEQKTLFMTMLAAFQILLYRYTNQVDICVGTPIANRGREEIENLIGFFVNTLVLRADLSGNPTFLQLLEQVHQLTVEAYDNQDVPFERLVDELNLERAMSHTPLFQTMFTIQDAPHKALQLSNLTIEPINIDSGTAKFDLTLSIIDRGDQLLGIAEYNVDLFESQTIERLIDHYQILLEGIVNNPNSPISDLPILGQAELRQVVIEWNKSFVSEDLDNSIHQMVEFQVSRTPDRIAIVNENQRLTYKELNNRANQLAHHLMELGVGHGNLIGVCMNRSIEMVIAILGVLKSGGAYVPIDPNYPLDRQEYMIRDAGVSTIIANDSLRDTIPDIADHIVYLDKEWSEISHLQKNNPPNFVESQELAYVLYTSGSTGLPKGVAVEHKSAVALIQWAKSVYSPDDLDGVLFSTSISFDLSIFELFVALSWGGKVILTENVFQLPVLINSHEVNLINTVPSAITELIRLDSIPDSVKIVNLAGEPLKADIVNGLYNKQTIDRVYDLYGPSEDTTYSTFALRHKNGKEIIGRPISNTNVYLLDDNMSPVPIGVHGELYISGYGLARGYLNRPELTAERFTPNPLGALIQEAGSDVCETARMYRTGDLARYLPDGNIEYLGRVDHQIKLRGFRIELGEIEAVLEQYETIREAVAWVREDEGIKQLVGYIVPDHLENPPIIVDIREYLGKRLPEFMIPTAFVILDELPLTPNGKVDRNALPEPEFKREDLGGVYVAPSNKEEDILVEIWEHVLGTPEGESIGVHDNFFELGGDSMLSIQIIARANQAGISITPRDMFEAQTIHELAQIAGREKFIHAEQGIVTGSVPLTPIQHYFFGQGLINPHHWNQALMLDIRSEEDSDAKKREEAVRSQLEQALQHILIHHDVLRMLFEFNNSSWAQSNADVDEYIPFEWVDMSAYEKGERITRMEEISADYQSTLNISGGPLIRVIYFDFGPSAYSRLLFIIHHLAVDGISWRIILEDFQTVFLQLNNNMQVSLPLKTTSYRYWAKSLIDYSRTEEIKQDLDYWVETTMFSNPPLPHDHSNGENLEESAQNIRIVINREDTLTLLQEVPKAYNTEITDVLLTALVMTFNKWTGVSSIFVNLEGHGREDITMRNTEHVNDKMGIDISRTVGWFTSLFPIRLSVGTMDGIGEALASIKEQLRKIPNRGFTYGILRYLSPWADKLLCDIDGNKLFVQPNVSFNFLGKVDEGMINPSTAADIDRSQDFFLGLSENNFGPVHSPINKRDHLIDIISSVTNGQLRIEWIYSENYYKQETIQELADSYVRFLLEITTHCLSRESVVYTPSDFEDVDMDQEDLDAILDELGEV